jgi:hypothetical protein
VNRDAMWGMVADGLYVGGGVLVIILIIILVLILLRRV